MSEYRRPTNRKPGQPLRWVMLAVVLLLASSLGCSRAPLTERFRRLEPLVFADSPGRPDLATRTPWPTFTSTLAPLPTPTPTFTPPATPIPIDTATPTIVLLPTSTPIPPPTVTPVPVVMAAPPPTATPWPTPVPAPPQPTATPTTAPTPTPSFTYQAVEVYKDRTSNPFLTGYVAVVNAQEIPIGGVKAVGVFEPGGRRHESSLSKWFFEGYSAPGPVVKSSSVKFEPGGIEKGTWLIHLESEQGARLSDDVRIDTDPDKPEWFFIKFKQPGSAGARAATPSLPYATPYRPNSPVATPTSAPATSGWSFANVQAIPDPYLGGVLVHGEMVNNTGSAQQISRVTGTFYDNQGTVIAGPNDVDDYWPMDVLPPGAKSPFEIALYDVDSVADFDLQVVSQPSSVTPRQDFEFSNVATSSGSGEYCVEGDARNPGGQLQEYLVVVAILYNGQGNVVNFDYYDAPYPEDITGQEVMEFEICIDTLDQDVTLHELRAWGE